MLVSLLWKPQLLGAIRDHGEGLSAQTKIDERLLAACAVSGQYKTHRRQGLFMHVLLSTLLLQVVLKRTNYFQIISSEGKTGLASHRELISDHQSKKRIE